MSSIWDYCVLDESTNNLVTNLENFTKSSSKTLSINGSAASSSGAASNVISTGGKNMKSSALGAADDSGIDGLQESLVSSESSCRSFMEELDSLLHTLGEVSSLHNDVTGRTNSLMFNCENLLEQQVISCEYYRFSQIISLVVLLTHIEFRNLEKSASTSSTTF
jgi:hypothetical protein